MKDCPVKLLIMVDGKIACVDHFRSVSQLVNWIYEGWPMHDIKTIRPGHITVNNGNVTLLMQDGNFLP